MKLSERRVIDTGILVGASAMLDQHHENCLEYLTEDEPRHIAPPTTVKEFEPTIQKIRSSLVSEVKDHRKAVSSEVSGQVDLGTLTRIKENVLDPDMRSHRYLYQFYENRRPEAPFSLSRLLGMLSDMIEEIREDKSVENGDIWRLVERIRGKMPTDENVSDALLLSGNDKQICLEGHHIADNSTSHTELATVDHNHFINSHDGESVSRKENILQVTALDDVNGLAQGPFPWQ